MVLVNKALTTAYKATNNYCTLEKQTELNLKHSYYFSPFDIQGFVPEVRARTKYVTIYFCLKILNREFNTKLPQMPETVNRRL